jgi:hypothetical protein
MVAMSFDIRRPTNEPLAEKPCEEPFEATALIVKDKYRSREGFDLTALCLLRYFLQASWIFSIFSACRAIYSQLCRGSLSAPVAGL